jgi:hypothetical protein
MRPLEVTENPPVVAMGALVAAAAVVTVVDRTRVFDCSAVPAGGTLVARVAPTVRNKSVQESFVAQTD